MSDVPIETLVEHLLAAKRSLSTMTAVVRANEICTTALHAYEESVVLNAETEYLRRGMANQLSVLARVKRSLNRTYDAGKKEFKQLIRMMDAADARMQATTATLRERIVQPEFREGENDGVQRSLLDFVADERVSEVVKALKASVKELQVSRAQLFFYLYSHPYSQIFHILLPLLIECRVMSRAYKLPLMVIYYGSKRKFAILKRPLPRAQPPPTLLPHPSRAIP